MQSRRWFRESLHSRARRLVQLIEADAPDVIIANEVRLLLNAACGFCAVDVWRFFAEQYALFMRQSGGFCQTCDTLISRRQAVPPICEQCEAREEAESRDDP